MSIINDRNALRNAMTRRIAKNKTIGRRDYGFVGNLLSGDVNVTGAPFFVYVTRMNGEIVQCLNLSQPATFGAPVIIGYDPDNRPNTLQILGAYDVYPVGNKGVVAAVSPHHQQHEEFQSDQVFVGPSMWTPSLPTPSGLVLSIYPDIYRLASSWVRKTTRTTINLTSYVPVTASKAKVVLVVLTSAGAFAVRDGGEFASSVLDTNDTLQTYMPEPSSGDYSLCGVILYTGQTHIQCNGYVNHIIDLRHSRSAAGTGGYDLTAIHRTIAGEIASVTEKTSALGADLVIIEDSAAANVKKRMQLSNILALVDFSPYVKKDGSTAFTGAQPGVDPVSSTHLATKNYVDNLVTVKEVDGTPTVTGVKTIRVSNGTLTNDGAGQVTITTGGGGGGTLGSDLIDVSSQVIAGGETHFTFSPAASGVNVIINGLVQKPSVVTMDGDGLGLTLSFGVVLGANVIVQRLTPAGTAVTVPPGLKIYLATTFR